jgi:uncharacterized protein YjiS (DUF1127 family)
MEPVIHPPLLRHPPRPLLAPRLVLGRAVSLLAFWYERHLQRRDLAALDEHLRRDLGLTPDDVRRQCARPFWK